MNSLNEILKKIHHQYMILKFEWKPPKSTPIATSEWVKFSNAMFTLGRAMGGNPNGKSEKPVVECRRISIALSSFKETEFFDTFHSFIKVDWNLNSLVFLFCNCFVNWFDNFQSNCFYRLINKRIVFDYTLDLTFCIGKKRI